MELDFLADLKRLGLGHKNLKYKSGGGVQEAPRDFMRVKMIQKIFLIFLLLSLSSSLAYAQGGQERKGLEIQEGKGMPGPKHHPIEDWIRRLKLTEEQMARLQDLRESYLRETLVWRNNVVIMSFELRDLMRKSQPDLNKILAKQREISDLESKIEGRVIQFQLGMRKILTPDQIKLIPPDFSFDEFRELQMMPGRGRRMGRELGVETLP